MLRAGCALRALNRNAASLLRRLLEENLGESLRLIKPRTGALVFKPYFR